MTLTIKDITPEPVEKELQQKLIQRFSKPLDKDLTSGLGEWSIERFHKELCREIYNLLSADNNDFKEAVVTNETYWALMDTVGDMLSNGDCKYVYEIIEAAISINWYGRFVKFVLVSTKDGSVIFTGEDVE